MPSFGSYPTRAAFKPDISRLKSSETFKSLFAATEAA